MWLMAAVNMEEKNRHFLKQPYLFHTELKRKQVGKVPYRTKEETLDFIFEGL